MNAELHPLRQDQLAVIVYRWPEREAIVDAARLCDPLFIALLGPTLLGFVGFIPGSTLSDTAYVWVHVTPAVREHKLAVARLARRALPTFHTRYPNLRGHCFTAPARNWLRTLGARFWPDNVFTIEASNG